jgi:diacylglycerol kinase (ATP)
VKWLAIANPAAGRALEVDRLAAQLRASGDVDARLVRTAAPGDATRLARDAADVGGVIAIGGDGTIAEILQGMDLPRQHLAVLPAGHGNCLARDLGVARPEAALAALRRCDCLPLDLMEVRLVFVDGHQERRLCASTLAIGYVTEVVSLGRRRLHRLGRGAYAAAALCVRPRRFEVSIAASEGIAGPRAYTGIIVNNTAHLANFRGFPDGSVRDGVLDIMEQDCGWPRQLLHNLAVLAGSRRFGPRRLRQSASERLEFGAPATVMADGELLPGVMRMSVDCRPDGVRCVAGAA